MYRVVIVEDDPMVALLDRTYVERDPRFRVVQTFQDGRAALEWLGQNPAELAVLDVYMPLLTGAELLRELRAEEITLDVIMVTAANDSKTVDRRAFPGKEPPGFHGRFLQIPSNFLKKLGSFSQS